jgi:hypothetical protein
MQALRKGHIDLWDTATGLTWSIEELRLGLDPRVWEKIFMIPGL